MQPARVHWLPWQAPGPWICVAATVVLFLVKLWWLEPVGPVVFFDEFRYKLAAEAMAGNGPYPNGHYPFLYPASLAPALVLGTGYAGIFFSNALMSSLLVPACYLLARTLGMRQAWIAAIAAALLTLHAVFPTQVMSENLFVPAFTFATWVAIRGKAASPGGALAYGLLLGGLFLVKYLALPAIPLLWAFWLLNQRYPPIDAGTVSAGTPSWRRAAMLSAIAALAIVASWLWYAHTQGIPIPRALGAGVSGVANDGAVPMQAGAVGVWAVAYLAVIVLVAGPFLALFGSALVSFAGAPLRLLRDSRMARMLLLVALLTGGYWLLCIQHSASGAANYPVPQRVVARYLMLLTPLYLVAGLALIGHPRFFPGRGVRLAIAAASVAALALATGILFHDLVWDFTDWFATIPLYASDVMWYRMLPLAAVALLLAGSAPFVGSRAPLRLGWMLVLCALLVAALLEVDGRARRTAAVRPIHARVLLPFVERAIAQHGRVLVVSGVPEAPRDLQMALGFWGVDGDALRVVRPAGLARAGAWRDGPVLVATTDAIVGEPLQRYRFWGRTAHVIDASGEGTVEWSRPGAASLWSDEPGLCPGQAGEPLTLHWDVGDTGVDNVDVYLVNDSTGHESLFARGARTGEATTGDWIRPLATFRMRPTGGDRLLDQLIVGVSADCPATAAPGGNR